MLEPRCVYSEVRAQLAVMCATCGSILNVRQYSGEYPIRAPGGPAIHSAACLVAEPCQTCIAYAEAESVARHVDAIRYMKAQREGK